MIIMKPFSPFVGHFTLFCNKELGKSNYTANSILLKNAQFPSFIHLFPP